jgi:hypothetical protein
MAAGDVLIAAPLRVNDHPQGGWLEFSRPYGGERQKHIRALIVAVVTGCIAPGLKTTNYSCKNVSCKVTFVFKSPGEQTTAHARPHHVRRQTPVNG